MRAGPLCGAVSPPLNLFVSDIFSKGKEVIMTGKRNSYLDWEVGVLDIPET